MAGSTISLDSLSSPSPSPSPPPESNKPAEPTSAGLDSDSELSELTEEEQEADKRDKAPRKGVRNGVAHRGGRPSRRGGRRKTNSIVPAPMWGWAETRSSNVVEEEEEEEIAGPPRAMEEEEDEEGGRDDEEEEEEEEPDAKQAAIAPEEDDPPAAEDEDDFVSGDDDLTYRSRRSKRKPSPLRDASINVSVKNADNMDVEVDDGADEASDTEAPPGQINDFESEDDNANRTETEDEGDDDKDALPAVHADEPVTAINTPMEMDVDVDVTAPSPQRIAPLAAAAAASSIMAGSEVIDPPSPSPSQHSTPASSRSNSPAPGTDAEDAADVNAVEEKDDDDAAPALVAADVDVTEQEGVEEQDQEADDVDVDDTNLDDDADNEVESDLQPAHRAEALDVLATIELKFALLRERVYVEKMENLAWEEALVNEGTHPELLHLQRELSNRRDKRIELATRKRLLEVANVNKRRRTDEDGIWSWWKLARDDLQTEMIAETNRKRRRMERERRANDRHQPARAIPPANQDYPLAQPLRKIIKSIPFSNMPNKSSKKHRPSRLVYPELSSLSDYDIAFDMDCIFQTQRERSRVNMPLGGYEMQHVHRIPGAYPNSGPYMNGANHAGYTPVSHSHQSGFNDGGPINGRPYPNGVSNVDHRIPPFQQGPPQHVHHHLPPPPQPMMSHSHSHTPFPGTPGLRNIHMQQSQQHPASAPLHSHGHHSHAPPPPPHNMAPSFSSAADQDIPMHPPHTHNHVPSHTHGAPYYTPRRSPSPNGMGIMPNGGSSNKMGPGINETSSWMGSGMGMEHVYTGSGPGGGKGSDWGRDRERNGRPGPDEDERERMVREREKRERDQRDRERERDMQRDRERDEIERERQRDMHHLHHQSQHQQMQQQHRHQPSQHMHLHSGPPGAQSSLHHINGPHHHHRPHHHHVLHHHHQPSSGAPSSHSSTSLPQGLRDRERERSEREREYDSRPHPSHNQHPTEVINLTSSKSTPLQYHDQHPPPDFRDARSKHGPGSARPPSGPGSSMTMDDKDRPLPMPFALPPSHGLSPQNHGPPSGSSSMNGRMSPRNSWNTSEDNNYRGSLSHSTSSGPPQGPQPPGPYHSTPHESGALHIRSPNQSHRYTNNGGSLSRGPPPPGPPSTQQPSRQNSIGLHSPPRPTLPRPPVPPAPASPTLSTSAPASYPPSSTNSNHSPSRFAASRSPPINLKMRPPSPLASKMPAPYAALSGPGRTSTPTSDNNGPGPAYPGSGRGPESMMSFQGHGRGYIGANDRDRDKEREKERERDRERERERPPPPHFGPPPPPPVPSKMSVPQMVDGH